MKFITLTKITYTGEEGDPSRVRQDCIEAFWPVVDPRHGGMTVVQLNSGTSMWVKETPEQIETMLSSGILNEVA